jgi:hypothetical protein
VRRYRVSEPPRKLSSANAPPSLSRAAWDGTDWTHLASALNPSARWGPRIVFDSNLGTTVLFGGGLDFDGWVVLESNAGFAQDTWEFAP